MSAPAPVVRFRRVVGPPSYYTARYEVLADGKVLGYVESVSAAHDRWKASTATVVLAYDTRHQAAAHVLGHTLGLSWYDARELAKTGRNETKAERAAAG